MYVPTPFKLLVTTIAKAMPIFGADLMTGEKPSG